MTYLIHFFYGLVMGYFGLISPGMLNMTALKISLSTNKNKATKFAFGAASVVFIQAGIALVFADYLVQNPSVIKGLKVAGVFVFFALSIFFFLASRKDFKTNSTTKKTNYIIKGIGMSTVNMLAIPFYLGLSIYLTSIHKIIIKQPYILFFIVGAAIGAFLLFYTYIVFAKIIKNKVSFIAKNINILLSVLFLFLGILTITKLIT
jgi:threonine/homoserine/homoserine lactone efflux protein